MKTGSTLKCHPFSIFFLSMETGTDPTMESVFKLSEGDRSKSVRRRPAQTFKSETGANLSDGYRQTGVNPHRLSGIQARLIIFV